jgi:hypothetical protein
VRTVLKTGDGAPIAMTYVGLRHGPADVLARLAKGEAADPASYYFRTTPLFQTASPKYAWINNVITVGAGTACPRARSTACSKFFDRDRQRRDDR